MQNMDGAIAGEEQYSWMLLQFIDLLVENKEFGIKINEIGERILQLRKEQQTMINRQTKIAGASNLLELFCKAFQSANKKMREGGVSQVKSEWYKLITAAENPDESPIHIFIDRMNKINIGMAVSQQGDCSDKKKQLLAAEMDMAMLFCPSLLALEDDLINQNKLLRMERTQLEEKVKRTLGTLARVKLDLSKYEDECRRLQNILQKCSSALWLPLKIEINKMSYDLREIEKKTPAIFSQWQVNHNMLCEILDDVRMFNVQAIKENEKIWQLCRLCKQFNSERLELIYQLREKTGQGHH